MYPSYQPGSQELYTCKDLKLPGNLNKLYQYLYDCCQITDLQHTNPDHLSIRPDHVLNMIKNDREGCEKMVPDKVAKAIRAKGLFEFKPR